MSACLFVGPTVTAETAHGLIDAICLPPAAQGDLYRASLRRPRPRVIGLIDGYFRTVPAVRHKEILWVMANGIHVFGAASMGALRAAELADFGMIGIGSIFEDYRAGILEDDDEVAVDHGPAELGYLPVNEAMVDIRATLAAAVREGIIDAATNSALVAIAKRTFYARRAYKSLLDGASKEGLPPRELDTLRGWIPAGRAYRKRDDAVAMLKAMQEFLATDPPPFKAAYRFERTEVWEQDVLANMPAGDPGVEQTDMLLAQDVLDELRLTPDVYREVRREALTRALVLREADRLQLEAGDEKVEAAECEWAHDHHVEDKESLEGWLTRNHLDPAAFADLIREETLQRKLEAMAEPLIDRQMLNAMRMRGQYAALAARALRKRSLLARLGSPDVDVTEPRLSTFELAQWYCDYRLRIHPPLDIEAFSAALGFPDPGALCRALLREYIYVEKGEVRDLSDGQVIQDISE